jgi:hypothetical protein
MTDPELLRGRAVGKVIQRGAHIMLMFSVPGRADVPEIRLYLPLDGEVVLDPEPADVGEVDLQKLFYLYDLAALTVDDVELDTAGNLRIGFTDGTELTAVAGRDAAGWSLQVQEPAATDG